MKQLTSTVTHAVCQRKREQLAKLAFRFEDYEAAVLLSRCNRLNGKLLTGNWRQKRDDVALHVDSARFLGLHYQVVLELPPAEGVVAQVENEHIVLRTAQRNLFRRHVLDHEEDFSPFLLIGLAFPFGLSFFLRFALFARLTIPLGQLEPRNQMASLLQICRREVSGSPLRIGYVPRTVQRRKHY